MAKLRSLRQVATMKPLGENEYLVPVTYAPLPSFADLEKEFGRHNVLSVFDGRPFQKHASCLDMDETPGERIMLVKLFGRLTMSEDNIVEMDKLGYRPATHLELYTFWKARLDPQRRFQIIALGSFVASSGNPRCVVALCPASDRRIFCRFWFTNSWNACKRFLFVRK